MKDARNHLGDEHLMAAIAQGDERAFATLVDRHLSWAMRFVVRILGNKADAEDTVQLAYLRVWQGATGWTASAQFKTWFYRVLYNLCMDHFRRHGRVVTDGDVQLDELMDEQPSQEAKLIQQERDHQVQKVLASLPVNQRMALVLCYFEGVSQAESAALMGVSEGALESLLARGRAAIRSKLPRDLH